LTASLYNIFLSSNQILQGDQYKFAVTFHFRNPEEEEGDYYYQANIFSTVDPNGKFSKLIFFLNPGHHHRQQPLFFLSKLIQIPSFVSAEITSWKFKDITDYGK
jgi:hypothetical protein